MQGALGLGRKDGNTGGLHKNGWIPAFAGMTGVAAAGMTGWGVCDAKTRTAWSEWEGSDIIACVGSVAIHTNSGSVSFVQTFPQ